MANAEQLAILKQGVKVWNKWRARNPMIAIDLQTINLLNIELEGVNLSEANLTGANLINARLQDADFSSANLCDTGFLYSNLSRADLTGANLSGSHLMGSNFDGAILEAANLTRAVLTSARCTQVYWNNANLAEAFCDGTIFGETDLSNVKGLDSVRHSGSSILGVDTIFRTKPRLPDVFLRGCGVPEILIENLPYMLETAIDLYSCFISYSHKDKSFAQRVFDTLQSKGIRCYLDEKQMIPGDDIYEEIHRGIRYWDKVLLCCSKSSLKSWWVDQEINKAFQKERDLMNERGEKVSVLIPLDLDGYLFGEEYQSGMADEIRRRIAAKFKGWKRNDAVFEREIERVIRALRTDGGKEPPPSPKL